MTLLLWSWRSWISYWGSLVNFGVNFGELLETFLYFRTLSSTFDYFQKLWLTFPHLQFVLITVNLEEDFREKHGLRTHKGKIPNSLLPKFKSQSQINIWNVDVKSLIFCRNNGWIMENMDKGLSVPKCPKIYLTNMSAHCTSLWDINGKRLHWASVVCGSERRTFEEGKKTWPKLKP